ncbi:MAG: biotin--[acetyl-CoA-carboxylase] ligase [Blastococcus sp.]
MPTDQPSRPPLDPDELTARAASGAGPWRAVEVVAASPSTNAALAGRARQGEAPGLVLVAEHQTAGRGRLDRVWVTPPGAALTFSALLAPGTVPTPAWPWLPLLTGLAVAEGVRRAAGVEVTLKWPNDVLVEGGPRPGKLAGILVERVERATGDAVAVVGVGLNVTSAPDELPVPTATSLALAGATSLDRGALLLAVLDALGTAFRRWSEAGGDAVSSGLHAAYVAACGTVGRAIRVELPTGGALDGVAEGVDPDGRLRVRAGGRVHVLGAGDVVHARHSLGPVDGPGTPAG